MSYQNWLQKVEREEIFDFTVRVPWIKMGGLANSGCVVDNFLQIVELRDPQDGRSHDGCIVGQMIAGLTVQLVM